MSSNTIAGLELAQIGWVVPDINAAVKFLAGALGVTGFPQPIISEVDHPIARMAFFDTYQTLGVATEIMGITPEGWTAIEQMQKGR